MNDVIKISEIDIEAIDAWLVMGKFSLLHNRSIIPSYEGTYRKRATAFQNLSSTDIEVTSSTT
jgi:hypothetical protein